MDNLSRASPNVKSPDMRALLVYSNASLVGALVEENNVWRFRYDREWVSNPDAYPLAPSLPLGLDEILDGSSTRPVQWYFDNLLPEERLREIVAKEAGIRNPSDSFSLLEYLGKESAGSLTLLRVDEEIEHRRELRALPDEELSERIRGLPRSSLVKQQIKRMSLAGAQHKMLAVIKGRDAPSLYEPMGAAPSTHILKPDHPDVADYPASVMNEYVTMLLSKAAKLRVPEVRIRFVPEPVYCIERFDRNYSRADMDNAPPTHSAEVERLHVLDACQLLNLDSAYKYSDASLEALSRLIELSTNKASTRLDLFRWLVFNMAVGNNDNHLKNLSFFMSAEGLELAPHYDMLCTLAYETTAITQGPNNWEEALLVFPLPAAKRFSEVTRERVIEAGALLGLRPSIAGRIVDEIRERIQEEVPKLLDADMEYLKGNAQRIRVANVMRHIVIREMLDRLRA